MTGRSEWLHAADALRRDQDHGGAGVCGPQKGVSASGGHHAAAGREPARWPGGPGTSLFGDHTTTPLALLRRTALEHNAAVLRDYCRAHGVDLAPHGKTTMSPELGRLQLDHGAWGITAATAWQAQVLRGFGVDRILLANELVDPPGLRWAARELEADAGFELICYADSTDGVEIMTEVLTSSGFGGHVDVLVELGGPGGRTGCRTAAAADAVCAAVARSPRLRLRGVAAFEGVWGRAADAPEQITRLLERVRATLAGLRDDGRLDGDAEAIVSAGGSAHFDRVVEVLAGDWPAVPPVRVVLRSGCYLTHDHGSYRALSPLDGQRVPGGLRPALEVWGRVLSHPEPGLAFADVGRRDVSHDAGLPVVIARRPRPVGAAGAAGGGVGAGAGAVGGGDGAGGDGGGARGAALREVAVTALNDQHAYMRTPVPSPLAIGDLVGFGISHPCTTLDRWRVLPVVEDDDTVAGFVRTCF